MRGRGVELERGLDCSPNRREGKSAGGGTVAEVATATTNNHPG